MRLLSSNEGECLERAVLFRRQSEAGGLPHRLTLLGPDGPSLACIVFASSSRGSCPTDLSDAETSGTSEMPASSENAH